MRFLSTTTAVISFEEDTIACQSAATDFIAVRKRQKAFKAKKVKIENLVIRFAFEI